MIIQQAPSYNAASNGLRASYAINFNADANHTIPLMGMFQGDRVDAKTLYVNNFDNDAAITFTLVNTSGTIPPYAEGYIDIRGQNSVTLTCSDTSTVNFAVLNWVVPEGFRERGLPPAGLTNDPFWSKVCGLWHCNGVNGFNVDKNIQSAVTRLGNMIGYAGAVIDTSQKYFGSSSFKIPAGGSIQATPISAVPTSSTYGITVEFFFKSDGFSAIDNQYSAILNASGSTNFGILLSAGKGYLYAAGNAGGNIQSNVPCELNTWYHGALTLIDGLGLLFLNGANVASGNVTHGGGDIVNFTLNSVANNLRVDEVRVTTFARYMSNFNVPTSEFFSQ